MCPDRPEPPVDQADRLLIVLSDLEMGTGGPMDDFPQSESIGELLSQYNTSTYRNQQIEVIFNGDTFDFIKIDVDGSYPHHVTAAMAHAKLAQVAAAHRAFFQSLHDFLAYGSERRLHFLVGNHDLELLFPSIKEALAGLIDRPGQVFVHDFQLNLGQVHIEHGHQRVGMFHVNPKRPFLTHKGQEILNLPWGNVALLDGLVPFKPLLYGYDRIKPKDRLFLLLPQLKALLNAVYWRYWTKDFWRRDPLKRLNPRLLKDVLHAIFFVGPDTILSPAKYRRALARSKAHRLYLIGHEHKASSWSHKDKKLLYTGCFRNEYLLQSEAPTQPEAPASLQLQPKIYAEVWMQGDQALDAHLLEAHEAPPPPGYQPASLLSQPDEFLQPSAMAEIIAEYASNSQTESSGKSRLPDGASDKE